MTNKPYNYDEGLGTVYERIMLNDYFDGLLDKESISTVLEAPFFGMTGLTGINSVHFAQRGCHVTLVDAKDAYVEEARYLWEDLQLHDRLTLVRSDFGAALPFADRSFDFVWNFAALWHWQGAADLLAELCRVAKRYVFIAMPNNKQIGYFLRKKWLDKEFFDTVDESWMNLSKSRKIVEDNGFKIVDHAVLDVPPWPDTCMPVGVLLEKLGLAKKGKKKETEGEKGGWNWDIMRYYAGEDPGFKDRVEKYAFVERLPIYWKIKIVWAHHRYFLAERQG